MVSVTYFAKSNQLLQENESFWASQLRYLMKTHPMAIILVCYSYTAHSLEFLESFEGFFGNPPTHADKQKRENEYVDTKLPMKRNGIWIYTPFAEWFE